MRLAAFALVLLACSSSSEPQANHRAELIGPWCAYEVACLPFASATYGDGGVDTCLGYGPEGKGCSDADALTCANALDAAKVVCWNGGTAPDGSVVGCGPCGFGP